MIQHKYSQKTENSFGGDPARKNRIIEIRNVNKFHIETPRKNAEKKTGFTRCEEYA